MNKPLVSIIIPVYKAEKYIEECARSLFGQTMIELEYIFVDDCGCDNSIYIIKKTLLDYPLRLTQTKFIYHSENEGVSKSRQDGVNAASGEYIIHCDADDWVELEMYEKLFLVAKENDLDMVVCGYQEVSHDKNLKIEQNLPSTKLELIEYLIDGKLHGALWNKLIKRCMYKYYEFASQINIWEDLSACVHIFTKASRFTSIKDCLYNYRRTNNSITSNLSHEKISSMIQMGSQMIKALSKINNINEYSNIIQQIAFNSKKNLLITGNGCYNPQRWRNEFKEYNKYWYKVKATLLLRFFYLMTLLHLDFVTKIYVSRPPILLKIHRLIKRR